MWQIGIFRYDGGTVRQQGDRYVASAHCKYGDPPPPPRPSADVTTNGLKSLYKSLRIFKLKKFDGLSVGIIGIYFWYLVTRMWPVCRGGGGAPLTHIAHRQLVQRSRAAVVGPPALQPCLQPAAFYSLPISFNHYSFIRLILSYYVNMIILNLKLFVDFFSVSQFFHSVVWMFKI